MKFKVQNLKSKCRRLAISLATLVLITTIGNGEMIDESVYEIPISQGVVHRRVVQTYENGVQSVYLTIADLGVMNLSLDLLYNNNTGFVNRKELSMLDAQNPNAVASINGDFFQMSNPSYSTGIMVDDGKMISSPSYKNGAMASMVVDSKGNVNFDYLSSGVSLENTTSGNDYKSISINKHSTSFVYPIVFTNEYRKFSVGSTDKLKLTEMVVENSLVKEIRTGQKATPIPKDGFVVVASKEKANELVNKFKVGDSVRISTSAEQVYSDIKTAIGGGTMVLRGGQPTPITHQIKGLSQRTAVGITYDNKVIFMVTDGRTGSYIGMNENDVATFLKSQNVKDAMMLDGGGSSELIINGKITNNLVGKERKILNGLAVVNNAPRGQLTTLQAVLETDSIVQGDKVKLVVQGFDSGMNPVKLGSISATGSGLDLSYSNGYITANSGGTGEVLVSSGGATTSIPINVESINPNDAKFRESTGIIDFAVVPNGSSDANDVLGQVINAKITEKSAGAKAVINMFNKNSTLASSFTVPTENISQSGQIVSRDNTTFLGLSVSKGIGGTNGQWSAIKNALASGDKNVVIMMNGGFNLNSSEKKIFRKLVNSASSSKNVYVVSIGNTFGSYAEGNVSYITIMDNALAKGTSDADFKMLSFSNDGNSLSYSFEKLF